MMHPDFIHICLFALVSLLRPFIHSPGVFVYLNGIHVAHLPVCPSVGRSVCHRLAGRCGARWNFSFLLLPLVLLLHSHVD